MRPAISLADALCALVDLDPQDDEARQAILKCVGLDVELPAAPVLSLGAWQPTSSEEVTVVQRREALPAAPVAPPAPTAKPEPSAAERPGLGTTVTRIREGGGVFRPPAWVTQPGESLVAAEVATVSPSQSPLFGRLSQRGLLTATLATLAPEGEIDVDALIAIECEDRPLTRLPRISMPTLRRGTQVLVDHAAGMDPFAPDQALLLRQLDNILADDRLEILHFVGCPGRGVGAGPRRTWRAWNAPPAGTPVLAVTDLGIGGPMLDDEGATTAEWAGFAGQVRAAGCPLLALVPYEARRWPGPLVRAMTLIHWSERTTVRHVRRALRHARYRSA